MIAISSNDGIPSLGGHQCQNFILVPSQVISTEKSAAVLAGCARKKCSSWFSGCLSDWCIWKWQFRLAAKEDWKLVL